MDDKSMENLSPSEEIAISENLSAVHVESLLTQSDPEFLQKFGGMTFDQRLEAFCSLESRYAEAEGRAPRAVITFEGTESDDAFRLSKGQLGISKTYLERMEDFDDRTLAKIKKLSFSDVESELNDQKTISFGRTCEDRCIDNDVPSTKCSWSGGK